MEDAGGDTRRPGTIVANVTIDKRPALGETVIDGGRRDIRAAGGAGSSVFIINVDVYTFLMSPTMVTS